MLKETRVGERVGGGWTVCNEDEKMKIEAIKCEKGKKMPLHHHHPRTSSFHGGAENARWEKTSVL